jgi:hypothetical protein
VTDSRDNLALLYLLLYSEHQTSEISYYCHTIEVPSILLDSFEFNNWMHNQILCWINHLFSLALHFHWDIYFGCKYTKYHSVDLSLFIWFVATPWFLFPDWSWCVWQC